MGSPVFRAKAHGDLEHLRVHHVGYHSQEACGGGAGQGVRKQVGALSAHHRTVSAGENMNPPGKGSWQDQSTEDQRAVVF